MFGVLRQRNFALLWFGQLISVLGDIVLFVALPFFVYDQTGSVAATGAMFVAGVLPRVAFSSVAGVFVDRWDRRRTMIVADLLRAALLVPLLLLAGDSRDWLWVLYVVEFAQSTISLFFFPAKSAIIPSLIGEKDLMPANSLNAVTNAFARVVGPTMGGALLGLLGLPSVILADSVSFLVSAAMIALIVVPRQPALGEPGPNPASGPALPGGVASSLAGVWKELTAGLRVVRRERLVAALFAVLGVVVFVDGISSVLLVVFFRGVLRASAVEFGWLMTAQGLGALIGGFFIGQVSRSVAPARLITAGLLVAGVVVVGMVSVPVLPVALVLLFLAGAPIMGANVGIETLLQKGVADEYRGRVFGALGTATSLSMLGGMGLATALGGVVGAVAVLGLAGVLYALSGLFAAATLPAERPAPAATAEEYA